MDDPRRARKCVPPVETRAGIDCQRRCRDTECCQMTIHLAELIACGTISDHLGQPTRRENVQRVGATFFADQSGNGSYAGCTGTGFIVGC
ncbi:hypothetical protein K227x_06130 [Rubripirellula lacrimiformis]|uniref:Uncharacterized protein n=2 Tax=Rubripirellula lacrimiformis TaxID=1930273 RepID=A0A517N520_9BACT|nr:hypothetical protein K227x_06130 [Rubripirellula lacrimiformis]